MGYLPRCRWRYGSIFIRLAIAPEICEILWKFELRPIQFKVIDLGVNRKRTCNFLLVINSNFSRISYSFRDIDAFSIEIACFPNPTLVWRRAPSTKSIYHWKCTFSWLQLCCRHYSINRCCLPKISIKFDLIAVQGHPRSSVLCQSKAHMRLPISH